MGMPRDRKQRITLARVDDARRQSSVTAARRIIYDKQYPVNSAAVEALLRDESLTPNIVRLIIILNININTSLIICEISRMLSLNAWDQWASTYSKYCCLTRCMKLHLAYGGLYSFTYCEYCSQKANPSF